MWKLILIGFFTICPAAYGIELKPVTYPDVTKQFEVMREFQGHLEVQVVGQSFEAKNMKIKIDPKNLIYAGMSWGGVVAKDNAPLSKTLGFKNGLNIAATHSWAFDEEKDRQMVARYSDMTELIKKNPQGAIKSKAHYIYGGFTVIAIYKKDTEPKRWVGFALGLVKVKPGDIYRVTLTKGGIPGRVHQFSTWGAGAISGNGSANLLNDMTVSGLEDWNGSQGFRWDTDTVDVSSYQIDSGQGLTWSIDPLLQWIYPMGALVSVDLKEGK